MRHRVPSVTCTFVRWPVEKHVEVSERRIKSEIFLDKANKKRNTPTVLPETGDGDCNLDSYGLSRTLPFRRRVPRGRRNDPTPTLFPDVPDQRDSGPDALPPPGSVPERVGIARLAFSSPLADAKRGTEYFLLPVRSILNHCDSDSRALFLDRESLSRL